jgi:hypothetical protein
MLREVEDEVAERAPAEGLRRAVDRVYMRVLGESGATRPSPQVLAELSRVLEVPGEFFALSLVETHEGFFRSTRRTSVAHRRHARALGASSSPTPSSPAGQCRRGRNSDSS